ncbi:hypothetical protein JOF34_001829 [Microbacterium amylolyticum]|uniref:Helix-turn-helix domain-containing protein n=1 Tax=Microbacterium amylolyticum TaxID=936337 RepID=A0ABS4ZJQ9_9MICO|nr:hypothetical protein [Microbacterium amylolyticum]
MNSTTISPTGAPVLLNEHDAAMWLTVSVGSLRAWRGQGTGPRYIKVGAQVRYRPGDLDAYLESQLCEPSR